MANELELAQQFELFLPVSKAVTVADVLTMLQNAHTDFVVVVDNVNQVQAVQTLARIDQLEKLTDSRDISLAGVLTQLPSLVVIEGEKTILDSSDIAQLAGLLVSTDAPGVVVYEDGQVKGVVSFETIADALPLSAIPPVTPERLYGDAVTPERDYICRKCEQSCPPPPCSPYREGFAPPVCPRYPFTHGSMERG